MRNEVTTQPETYCPRNTRKDTEKDVEKLRFSHSALLSFSVSFRVFRGLSCYLLRIIPYMNDQRQDLGKQGEQIARESLEDKNYEILETNFRCKQGEIDIIARDRHMVVFVEVRTVTSARYQPPYNSVTRSKQQQVKRAALFYISKHNLVNTQFRFDVIGITLNRKTGKHQLDHIENAFA